MHSLPLYYFIVLVALICWDVNLAHVHYQRSDSDSTDKPPLTKEEQELEKDKWANVYRYCPHDIQCTSFVRCPDVFFQIGVQSCILPLTGHRGACCGTGRKKPNKGKGRGHEPIKMDPLTINVVARHSKAEVEELRTRESRTLLSAGKQAILMPGSASYTHYRNSRMFNSFDLSEVMSTASKALEIVFATKAFKNRHEITNHQLEFNMLEEDLRTTPLGEACAPLPDCPLLPHKYRKIDGTCNNARNPTYGMPLSPYLRLLPPNYEDGIWSPRVSVLGGHPLPSPRAISSLLISDEDIPNEDNTLLLMQFGQFLSHEITQSIDTLYENGSAISCCTQDGKAELPKEMQHYACMPINIPEDDYFYGTFGQRCMNFVRSLLAPRGDCTLGYSQQMNKVTHYIDGSSIYGSTPEQTGELRIFQGGRLKVFHDYGRELLPLSKDPDACLTMERGSACFASGDTRTNQMISLVVLHTVFMREHNRLAKELQNLNPYWDDDRLFLEARQILVAELQVVVYKEYLPALLGNAAMEDFGLKLKEGDEYSDDYDEEIDPAVSNEFASAAFRFGHSTVSGLLKLYGLTKMEEVISLPEVMFHPARLRKRQIMDAILSTLTTEPLQEVDISLSDALTKYMFRGGNPFGVDLASFNIQRGRDHGLRSYNDYRQLTGQDRIKYFEDFGPEIGPKLKSLYASVDDIDLWIGGLMEPKSGGSIVGHTFREIIADQFARLKQGDRYFFDLNPHINPGHFTRAQLVELRKASMSRIICDNSDRILLAKQAPNAFKKPGVPGNEFYNCDGDDAIPRINLIHWRE